MDIQQLTINNSDLHVENKDLRAICVTVKKELHVKSKVIVEIQEGWRNEVKMYRIFLFVRVIANIILLLYFVLG